MGIFEAIFKKPKADVNAKGYFKMLNGYSPVFTNAPESIYEMELTRAARQNLSKTLLFKPNPFQDTYKFLYRLATILLVNNTAFVCPIEDDFGRLVGYYPLLPQNCEVIDVGGKPYLRYSFATGQKAAVEFEKVGILTRFQYSNDFFGADNRAFNPTMQLIHTNNQGIINGVKNSAAIRFLAKIANLFDAEDIKKRE